MLVDEKSYQDGALHGHWRIWNDQGEMIQDCLFRFGDQVEPEADARRPLGRLGELFEPFKELTCETASSQYAQALF